MKYNLKFILGLFSILCVFSSCSKSNDEPNIPPKDVQLKIGLAGELSNSQENAYNSVVWNNPVLLQIESDNNCVFNKPSETDSKVNYSYKFDGVKGECRYWLTQSCDNLKLSNSVSISSWPLTIPQTQKPVVGYIDLNADVLTSDLSFAVTQDYLVNYPWKPSLKRHNAILKVILKGIPSTHSLESMVFSSNRLIAGTQSYDILKQTFTTESSRSGSMKVLFEGEIKSHTTASQSREVLLSMWPETLNQYDITVLTHDSKGNEYEYVNKYSAFEKPIVLNAQCQTIKEIVLKEKGSEPEIDPTPEDSEGVVEGKKGATLDLFNKIKAYKDNGISSVDKWWTHKLGYKGIAIHEAELTQYGKPLHMWVIEADPKLVGFELGTPYNNDNVPPPSLQEVSGQAARARREGKKVIAAVNGDAWGARGGFNTYGVMFKDGRCIKNWAIRANDIANTDTFYATNLGEVGIVDEDALKSVMSEKSIQTAIGGWYRLISQGGEPYAQAGAKDGDPLIRDKSLTSGSLANFLDRHPRTFMGVSDDKVYIVAVDGRQASWSVGLTLNGCARICYSLGCRRGINFDGGGSTAIVKYTNGEYKALNRPSDGRERQVVNSLLIVAR